MSNDIHTKIAAIKKTLFQQETMLKDQEHVCKELGSRLQEMRSNVG